MKVAIDSGMLAEAIASAVSSLSPRPTTPVLGGVLIRAEADAVVLSSFNYDRATTRRAFADVADTGRVLVSGRLLAMVGTNLPKKADVLVTVDGSELSVEAGRTVFRLPLMPVEDYPDLPTIDERGVLCSLDSAALVAAVKVIGGFASTAEQPANLTGINLQFSEDSLWLCATDRYIIGRRRLDCDGSAGESITVPAADMLAVIKAVGGGGDTDVLWNGSMLGLKTSDTVVLTRTLGEDFPSSGVDRVLGPVTYCSSATVNTAELDAMLMRAASFADDHNSRIDIAATGDMLSVKTSNAATGNIDDNIYAQQHGVDHRVTLSARRLHNALALVDDECVTLAFRDKGHIVGIHPGVLNIGTEVAPLNFETVALLMGIGRGHA